MFPEFRRLHNAGIQTYLSTCVATFHRFVSDIDMEDVDDAGSHLPAVDDLSNDETEGSGSSEFFWGSSFNDGTTQTALDPPWGGPVRTH